MFQNYRNFSVGSKKWPNFHNFFIEIELKTIHQLADSLYYQEKLSQKKKKKSTRSLLTYCRVIILPGGSFLGKKCKFLLKICDIFLALLPYDDAV